MHAYFLTCKLTNTELLSEKAALQLEVDALGLAQLQRRLKDAARKSSNQRNRNTIIGIFFFR